MGRTMDIVLGEIKSYLKALGTGGTSLNSRRKPELH